MRFSDKRSFILEQPESFLPNFCSNGVVFLVILIAELLAFVLTFAATESLQEFWLQLGPISLFIQWVALGAVAALCCFRVWIVTLSTPAATAAAYGLIQLVTLTFSLLTLQAADMIGLKFATDDWWQPHFVLRNLAISSIVSLVAFRYFYIQHQWKQNLEAEARARFQALQARIRPHFLFNSMNTIASLTRSQPEQAEEAILDLADLFRYTLEQPEKIRLQEELETTRRYLRIETLRLGERLHVDWHIDDNLPLDIPVPPLILQPLLENAVYHGIQPLADGGLITIRIQTDNNNMHFTVTNPLSNADVTGHQNGNQLAQDNIRQRLALAYGESSKMDIHMAEDHYQVHFSIPMKKSL